MDFNASKTRYKGWKVEELTTKLIEKFNLLLPDICKQCSRIYVPDLLDSGVTCFLCTKSMCPDCCSHHKEEEGFLSTLFSICLKCSDARKESSTKIDEPSNDESDDLDDKIQEIVNSPSVLNDIPSVFTPPVSAVPLSDHTPSGIPSVPMPGSTTQGVPSNLQGVPSRDSQDLNNSNEKVCSFYLRKNCKFYNTKEICKYAHPKLCNQWIKTGSCKNPDKCKIYYHPKLCHASVRNEACFKDKCNFFHLRRNFEMKPPSSRINPLVTSNCYNGPFQNSQISPPTNQNNSPQPRTLQHSGLFQNENNSQQQSLNYQDFQKNSWNGPQDLFQNQIMTVLNSLGAQVQDLTTWKNQYTR